MRSFSPFSLVTCVLLAMAAPGLSQDFAPIPALSFTKSFGGANPLPQIITVNSTGAPFFFTNAVSTSSGGNWLTLSNTNFNSCGNCQTPWGLNVSVNPASTLAAGTYTGQIVLTSGQRTLTIPVTLQITAPGAVFLDNLPGKLTFSFRPGDTSPAQSLQVRNGGPGALNWTLTTSTADGGNWLNVTPASGTAPSLVTVSINNQNLPSAGAVAGVFLGMLRFEGGGTVVTVPVSVTVGDDVFLQLNPISFTKPFSGANPLPQVLSVSSTGASFFFVQDEATATGNDWLQVTNANFNSCRNCQTPFTKTVSITAAPTLAAGSYTGQIVFASGGNIMVVPVNLTVAAPGSTYFDNPPGALNFSLPVGGPSPSPQQIQIRHGGPAPFLDWTLTTTTADNRPWLSAAPANGTTPSTLEVRVNHNNLPSIVLVTKTVVGQLLFRSANGSVTIPVTVTVGPDTFQQVNGLSFSKPFGGPNPLPQVVTIASAGAEFFAVREVRTATGGNWLSAANTNFNSCGNCQTPFGISVSVNAPPTLAAGTYTGQIIAASGGMSMTIPVTLTVAAPDSAFFDNVPGEIAFSLRTGGQTPPPQLLPIRNGGTGTLDWTATATTADGGGWLGISATSGTAPSQPSVSILRSSLPNGGLVAGTFTGQIRLQSGQNSLTIPVRVTVGDDVFRQINGLHFTMPFAGPNPLPQLITVASTGAEFFFVRNVSTATGGDWLSVTNANFNSCGNCQTPFGLVVKVQAPPTLAAGTYTGQIEMASAGFTMVVPVTLTVAPPASAFFASTRGHMSFLATPGAAAIPSQTVEVRNGGTGALNWTVTATTADGAAWLSATPPNGTAPSTVTVTVNRQLLPNAGLVAGTYTGNLHFQAPGSSMTVPVTVTTGPDLFVQLPPIAFTKNVGAPNPQTQAVTINSTAANFFFVRDSFTSGGGDWLRVSNTNGNSCGNCQTPWGITVSAQDTQALAAGTYGGEIFFVSGGMVMTVPVSLQVGSTVTAPTITSLTPAGTTAGAAAFTLEVAGTNFTAQSVVRWNGAARTTTFVNATTLRAQIPALDVTAVASAAITVFDPAGGTSNSVTFQIGGPVTPGTPANPQPADAAGNLPVNTALAWTATNATSYDVYFGVSSTPPLVATVNTPVYNPGALTAGTLYYWRIVARNGALSASSPTWRFTTSTGTSPNTLYFVPVLPCRIADTRTGSGFSGAFGPPTPTPNTTREIPVPAGNCGIPPSAAAYSLNVTVLPAEPLSYLTMWPTGQPQPLVSTLNSFHGGVVANAAIVPAGLNRAISVFVTNRADFIIDINGYFDSNAAPNAFSFYTVDPCRLADTRPGSGSTGPFGAPTPGPGSTRSYPLPGNCGLPTAAAYSLNVTVVPPAPLSYLTIFPTGQAQPLVSTLNSFDAAIVANAAIVPAGVAGAVSAFVTHTADTILDVNGYFSAPGSPNELRFQPVPPCRVADTRLTGQGAPILAAGAQRDFPVAGVCNVPAAAKAYSLNVTVVPTSALSYLTLWPAGKPQPLVSTLNSFLGRVVANAAIVPAGTNGVVSAFVTDQTHVILDINGYFQ
ncbi:MAG: hypothetical protein JNK87_09910 [Bryobacterales bacterium]|nr:hypothetical protein [Bryobacterales bacterium]